MIDPAPARLAPRGRCFAYAFLVLAANGAAGIAASTIRIEGWIAATLNLFGISAILWAAAAAGADLLLRQAPDEAAMAPADWIMFTGAGIAIVLPPSALSSLALTGLAIWALVRSAPGSGLRRAAPIFLAIAGSLLWGRLLLYAGSDTLLGLDGWIVGQVAGTGGQGNIVRFAGGAGDFFVAPGCSSLQGVSLAFTLWVTVVQYYAIPLTARSVATLAAALAGAVFANVLRLAAIATWPAHFETLHLGWGATAFGWLALAMIVGAIAIGLRGALFAKD